MNSPVSSDAWFLQMQAREHFRKEQVRAFIREHADRPFRIPIDRVWGRRCVGLVSRDPSNPDRWRCTRFDWLGGTFGPFGHSEHETFADAVAWVSREERADLTLAEFV